MTIERLTKLGEWSSPLEMAVGSRQYHKQEARRKGPIAIYRSEDQKEFLRVGPQPVIKSLIQKRQRMEMAGFAVPKFIAEGPYDTSYYYVETSLGPAHFGEIFANEVREHGHIQAASFDACMKTIRAFIKTQLTSRARNDGWDAFWGEVGIHDLGLGNEKMGKALTERKTRAEETLASFPFVLCHGDFNPFNIFATGIIDFEHSIYGPALYDALGLLTTENYFSSAYDDELEFKKLFGFSQDQRESYTRMLRQFYAEHGLPDPLGILDDIDFIKLVWKLNRMQHAPRLRAFRMRHLEKLIAG